MKIELGELNHPNEDTKPLSEDIKIEIGGTILKSEERIDKDGNPYTEILKFDLTEVSLISNSKI